MCNRLQDLKVSLFIDLMCHIKYVLCSSWDALVWLGDVCGLGDIVHRTFSYMYRLPIQAFNVPTGSREGREGAPPTKAGSQQCDDPDGTTARYLRCRHRLTPTPPARTYAEATTKQEKFGRLTRRSPSKLLHQSESRSREGRGKRELDSHRHRRGSPGEQ